MKALAIRQPWAWLIINAGKDVENRSRRTHLRGRILVHAAKGMTVEEYEDAKAFAESCGVHNLPPMDQLERGGIVGSVEVVDCLEHSDSPWYMGQKAIVLARPQPLPFTPYKGQLGFFEVNAQDVGLVIDDE